MLEAITEGRIEYNGGLVVPMHVIVGNYGQTVLMQHDHLISLPTSVSLVLTADLDAANARIAELEAHSAAKFVKEVKRRAVPHDSPVLEDLNFCVAFADVEEEWFPAADQKAQEA